MNRHTSAFSVNRASNDSRSNCSAGFEARALELYARLGAFSIDDFQCELALAARSLLLPSETAGSAIQRSLQTLPRAQYETLRLHSSGHNHRDIARRQRRPADEVLKDLAAAYVQVRMCLEMARRAGGPSRQAEPTDRDQETQVGG